jgi:hypothetical protein
MLITGQSTAQGPCRRPQFKFEIGQIHLHWLIFIRQVGRHRNLIILSLFPLFQLSIAADFKLQLETFVVEIVEEICHHSDHEELKYP